ncbi:MAG: DUF1559 domain-containing protein [Planctomycetia bacterium]
MDRQPFATAARESVPTASATGRPVGFGGFTAVELLVACGIVAAIVALMLPAVRAAQEMNRMNVCRNHIRRLADAIAEHETNLGYLPSGGWGDTWLGSGTLPSDSAQPGGWLFSTLPYLMADLKDPATNVSASTAQSNFRRLADTAIADLNCPTRRGVAAISLVPTVTYRTVFDSTVTIPLGSASDYAANGGSTATCPPMMVLEAAARYVDAKTTKVTFCHVPPGSQNPQTQSLAVQSTLKGHGQHEEDHLGPCDTCGQDMDGIAVEPTTFSQGNQWRLINPLGRIVLADGGIPDMQDGVVRRMSKLRSETFRDGLASTYLVGEKYVNADHYATGKDPGDNRPWLVGYSSTNVRWAYDPPARDEAGVSRPNVFGSGHRGGWNAAFADGSVRTQSYDIALEVHRSLAGTADKTSDRWPD